MKKAKKILALLLALLVVMGCSMSAFAATELTEEEINDTYNTANAMGIANKIKADLADADDVDYFSFEITSPCLITVNIEHAAITGAKSTYFTVDIINANGEDVLTFKSKGEEAKTSSAPFAAEKGTYYAAVSMGQSHSATLEYTLSATIDTAANTEKEPNDVASKATAMTLSTTGSKKSYYGTIANKDDPSTAETEVDVDYYSLDIPAAGAIYFYLYNGTSNKSNYKATLYAYLDGANAQPVAKALGSINITVNEASVISPSVGVNAGNYLLKIEGANGSDIGGYQTRVYYLTDDSSEYEYNNTKELANPITTNGKVYFGSTFDKNDVDYYRFYVNSANGGVKFKLAVNPSYKDVEGQWTISVIAPNKSVIKKYDATNIKAAEFETDQLEAGTYYVCVEAGNVASSSLYELSLKEKAAPVAPPKDDDDGGSFIGQIMQLPWQDFISNFTEWLPSIGITGIIGMLTSLFGSIFDVFTNLWANS